jgi:putative DNA primase/helicase
MIITLRAARPSDYMTKITAVGPDDNCPTPLWLTFLARVTDNNEELQLYLQRMCGYCLTGSVREHAMFFLYGKGANGKGVFTQTIGAIMGDYHQAAPMETFVVSQGERHPTDLAMLRGARLVTASETEEGRRWAEAKIKQLTGGDPITARFMRQDFFTYDPQFKLVIAGNHKPSLRSVDEAVRRRLNLIPFTVTIPLHERDPRLTEKLKAEWPGILAWMIEGCHEWQRIGLAPPKIVCDATEAYLAAEDTINAWMDAMLEPDHSAFESTADLCASFQAWSKRAGEPPRSRKEFLHAIDSGRGFTPHRRNSERGFLGYRIKRWNEANIDENTTPYWQR